MSATILEHLTVLNCLIITAVYFVVVVLIGKFLSLSTRDQSESKSRHPSNRS